MGRAALGCVLLLSLGCQSSNQQSPETAGAPAVAAQTLQQGAFPLRVAGTSFADAAGRPFEWRGITAFRLAEFIASGRETDAVSYLDWAKSEEVTVVRVLLMAQHLFKLSPDAGRTALPKLLDLAKARGIAVEVVALADTDGVRLDYEAHVRDIGRIAAERGNAFVELANEPGHPTQDRRVHDPAFLQRLAALLPDPVTFALGSIEYGDGFARGEYVTTHLDRGRGEWDHVLAVAKAADFVQRLQKPVVNDEPIGAAAEHQPGRRDNDPARFAAAAALTRLAGLGGTFHYEGGLQSRIPQGREAACFAAWRLGWTLTDAIPADASFVTGQHLDKVAKISGARAAFARASAGKAVIVLVDPSPSLSVAFAAGWKEARRSGVPGVQVVFAELSAAGR